MRVQFQFLVPGVEHAEEADLCAEMLGVASDFQECFGAGLEQYAVNHFLVLQGDRRQFVRQRKNDVHIGRRQQFPAARIEPSISRVGLTLRTVPIAA